MRTLNVINFVDSGLGDRLCGMALICLYARVENYESVHIIWRPYMAPLYPTNAEHRKVDIQLENVVEHIQLPSRIKITPAPHGSASWPHNLSVGSVDVGWFHSQYLPEMSLKLLEAELPGLRQEFGWTPPVREIVNNLVGEQFIAVHVRRTDKNLDMPVHQLEDRTLQHLAALVPLQRPFFVCTDSEAEAQPVMNFLREAGARFLTLPEMPKWKATYYDLAMMSRADIILQSCRSSSFSYFASFLGNNRLINIGSPL